MYHSGNGNQIGFIAVSNFEELSHTFIADDQVAVYLPFSYEMGGNTVIMSRENVVEIDMSVQDAMRFIATAGVIGLVRSRGRIKLYVERKLRHSKAWKFKNLIASQILNASPYFIDLVALLLNANQIYSLSSMNSANPTIAILYAFAANLGIAAAKTGAAFWTGSGSLLAEAIHSFADCGNQVLLYIGLKRSEKTATRKHPMGFGRESYIWSMMVAFILFSVGGVFSIHEGWQRYTHPYSVENEGVALLILLIALGLEYYSLKQAMAALQQEKGTRTLWQWFKETQSSELMVVTGEDLAAITGLGIALIMLGLTMITGNTDYDAVGSILIGFLLITVAIVVGSEVHSLLLGEAAEDISDNVQQYLERQTCVLQVLNVWAINHGNQVMVTIKAELQPDMTVSNAVNQINAMERQIKQTHARVKWIFFEIDNED